MSRFVTEADHKVIAAPWWDDGESVTIRRFSYGDRQALAGAAVKVGISKGEGGEDEMLTDVAVGEMNLAILGRGIVRWTLKGPDDKVPLLTAERIASLTEMDAEYILGEINEFNPRRQRSANEQEGF